eukprot:TRINITY_DN1288_c0_g1_i2.p1 TRINITY_DN1288_c0_g1~~TRINITY_DN1288_c0_g1_i2.p1  ORF type:complete len:353 (-),score=41.70 TRINITY_DN1288_c0_g1_i2:308-1366(-)
MQRNTVSWQKLKPSSAVERAFNPIRQFIEREVRIDPNHPQRHLSFSVGDPTVYHDFRPSEKTTEVASRKANFFSHETDPQGISGAREFLASQYSKPHRKVDPSCVSIADGCSAALWIALQTICNPGDEFLVPRPSFPILKAIAQVKMINFVDYKLDPNNGWDIDIPDLVSKITAKTKAILVNNPSNPLGTVLSRERVQAIVKVAEEHGLAIIADEVYERMVFEGSEFVSFADIQSKVPLFLCSAMSKVFLVPGWRIGWTVLFAENRPDLTEAMKRATTYFGQANQVGQACINEVLKEGWDLVPSIMKKVRERYNYLVENLKGVDGIRLNPAEGALYSTLVLQLEVCLVEKTS